MPLRLAPNAISSFTDIGTVAGSSIGTSVSAGGANTLGSWTQLVLSSAADCCGFYVTITAPVGAASQFAVNIGTGTGGNEVILVPSLMVCTNTAHQYPTTYFIPIPIKAGTRISAQGQGNANDNCWVSVTLLAGSSKIRPATGIDALGYNAAATQGVAVTASGSTNTKGSYAQIILSTSRAYRGFFFFAGSHSTALGSESHSLIDLAIGAAASEVVFLPNWGQYSRKDLFAFPPNSPIFWCPIAASARLSSRLQSSVGSAIAGVVFYGIY